jgi:hypothetical protein
MLGRTRCPLIVHSCNNECAAIGRQDKDRDDVEWFPVPGFCIDSRVDQSGRARSGRPDF